MRWRRGVQLRGVAVRPVLQGSRSPTRGAHARHVGRLRAGTVRHRYVTGSLGLVAIAAGVLAVDGPRSGAAPGPPAGFSDTVMIAGLSFNTACELGFRGSLEWERLMGAVARP